MKWTFGILASVFALGTSAYASVEVSATKVLQIDYAQKGESETLIYLANGKVARLDKNSDLIPHLKTSLKKKEWVNVTTTFERELLAVESIPEPEDKSVEEFTSQNSIKEYRASVIPTYDQAYKIYKGMNRRYQQESQCYNRAHVWSWEMLTKHQVRSMKAFLFFTRKYIRRYNFEWWFHVAPFVYVREDGKIKEKVMDYRYTYSPVSMKEWTDIFMHNNAECSEVTKYTDYEYTREDPAKGWCMLLKVPMYYYQPIDLEALDKKSKQKDFWGEWDLSNAYREAFGIYSK
ncbi:protein-glutamine glutaminase family protein [Peredibacter sp. HCB2-198]|uniref:protein-glutamine glutaminase family protein n=1 Tax=Peredibacter sp. HCB2-198 TaxID=3383025 RepID=UPI0038B5A25C